jgi:hypothetical protein
VGAVHGRRAGLTALFVAPLLAVAACSGGATASGDVSVVLENQSVAPGGDPVTTPAVPPSGSESIFALSATLRPGSPNGATVRTTVDVTVTNSGIDAAPLAGTVRLSSASGIEYGVIPGHPDGLVLDFGTVQPGDTVVRSYEIDLPVRTTITSVLVERDDEVGVEGSVEPAR